MFVCMFTAKDNFFFIIIFVFIFIFIFNTLQAHEEELEREKKLLEDKLRIAERTKAEFLDEIAALKKEKAAITRNVRYRKIARPCGKNMIFLFPPILTFLLFLPFKHEAGGQRCTAEQR